MQRFEAINIFRFTILLAMAMTPSIYSDSEGEHGTKMFVNWCVHETSDIFPEVTEYALPKRLLAYVIISTCRMDELSGIFALTIIFIFKKSSNDFSF